MTLTHFGTDVDLARTYDQHDRYRHDKPQGLWLSDESAEMSWSEWCRQEGFRDTDAQVRTDFRILDSANILHLKTPQEIRVFTRLWVGEPHYEGNPATWDIRWADLAKIHDGILITPYQWECRIAVRWYYSWDVASACVWNLNVLEKVTTTHPVPREDQQVRATA